MNNKIRGGCLCGAITFELYEDFKTFYHCHCKQCQTLTGSAFASNLLTRPENITWLKGQDSISEYEHLTREFSKSFCKSCGSAVPFINKSETSLIVPAGSLDSDTTIPLEANIFVSEKVCRLSADSEVKNFNGFPE
ncbi:MAG: GFA family protein [Aestuariibacter sp.]